MNLEIVIRFEGIVVVLLILGRCTVKDQSCLFKLPLLILTGNILIDIQVANSLLDIRSSLLCTAGSISEAIHYPALLDGLIHNIFNS